MKSHFSRFLYITLSRTGIREVFTSSLSLSDLIGESRSNKVANLSHLDYRVKPDNDSEGADYRVKFENDRKGTDASLKSECDSLCAGRSMVEMLGVLAIIGVLSVGAITGYSKAMMKYKLNKQTEQLNTVFNAVDRNLLSFNNIKIPAGTGQHITSYFIKMGEIPTEMVKNNSSRYIYDVFNNEISIAKEYFVYPDYAVSVYAIYIHPELSSQSSDNLAICQNIITIAKEHADSLYSLQTYSNNGSEDIRAIYRGGKYCITKCIRNITLDDIHKICTKHKGNTATGFTIQWHV